MSGSRGRIWAPWRIHYILGSKSSTCPFCQAAESGVSQDTLVLATWEHAYVVLNRYPYTGCHLMVCPKEHVAAIGDLSPDVYAQVMELVRLSSQRLQSVCKPNGLNIGINQGTAAGAGIAEHLHVHLVPRWEGDTNFMMSIAGTRVVSQDVEHAWQMLHPAFQDLNAL